MSAWVELVFSDRSDEHLRLCGKAMTEIQAEARRKTLREIRGAIKAEYLTDETGHPEDIGYQRGIDDALGVVDRMAEEATP